LVEFGEDRDVGAAQVVDVDVVAQAGAVRGRVVVAGNLQSFRAALVAASIAAEGMHAGLGHMVFTDGAILGCAGIWNSGRPQLQAVGEGQCFERVFDVVLV